MYRGREASGCLYVPAYPAWALSRVLPGCGPVVALTAGRAVSWSRMPVLKDVRPGDRADRILRLCPEARIHGRDASIEAAAWDAVLEKLHGVTPFIAPSDPPFAVFRAEPGSGLSAIAQELGIRIGLAGDRGAARLAAVRAADRHVLLVPADRRRSFLARFPVDLLTELGFPEEMPGRLKLFGYDTLGTMESLTPRQLKGQFSGDGALLHALLHPPTDLPVAPYVLPPSRVVSFEPEEAIDPGGVDPVLGMLARRGAESLGDMRTQRIVLELHVSRRSDPRTAGRLLPEPHRDADTLARFAVRLLREAAVPGDRIERVVLRLEALRRPAVSQASLFETRPAVLGAVRRVHRRFPEAIRRAVCRRDALFPEEAISFEPYEKPGNNGP